MKTKKEEEEGKGAQVRRRGGKLIWGWKEGSWVVKKRKKSRMSSKGEGEWEQGNLKFVARVLTMVSDQG